MYLDCGRKAKHPEKTQPSTGKQRFEPRAKQCYLPHNHTANIQNRYRIKLIAVLGESSICVSLKYMEWTGIYLFINTGSQSTVDSSWTVGRSPSTHVQGEDANFTQKGTNQGMKLNL